MCLNEIYFEIICNTGALHSGPLDFIHPAHPIATLLSCTVEVQAW